MGSVSMWRRGNVWRGLGRKGGGRVWFWWVLTGFWRGGMGGVGGGGGGGCGGGVGRRSGGGRVFGRAVGPKNLAEVRREVGLVFQEADDQLFCPTVYEDVAFGPRQFGLAEEAVAERVRRCLGYVGLSGIEERSPNRLSGGEK